MTEPVFGITFARDDNEARPVVGSDLSVVGIVVTAPNADEDFYPLNTPVDILSNDSAALLAAGEAGTLADALRGINDQLGDFQVAARVVVVRVTAGANDAETIANLLGSQANLSGIYALLRAGPDLGVIPRLIGVPGYTHQRQTGVTAITVNNPGTGYTSAPAVAFSGGGGGTGAAATAVLGTGTDAGKIVSITITNAGTGYTAAPTIALTGGGGGGAAATVTVDGLANAIVAALPGVLSKLIGHAIVEGPGTNNAAILSWRETILDERTIPIDMWVRVQEGTSVVTRPGVPRELGIAVRRDFEKRGVPGHSWANQGVAGIVGFARSVEFSLTDGATTGQLLLAGNVGIGVRGELGVESAISSSGFVSIATDNAGDDPLWQFYNVTRMRDYLHLGLLKTWRTYLGKFNITVQTVEAVMNTAKLWLRDLEADGHLLKGSKVGFEASKNSPENLRLGKIRIYFAAEEPPVLRRIDADSRRNRPALEILIADLATASDQIAA
ncbi:MAG: phage tail protein [Chelatococcus sp.]|nr:MAG: phage tail protein [Chelatococcus sp.]